ncbi:MAG: hypothetical protein IJW40_00200 [Clostridia bacterium]|nr:hypothetical protein [Clostridia bacterium]
MTTPIYTMLLTEAKMVESDIRAFLKHKRKSYSAYHFASQALIYIRQHPRVLLDEEFQILYTDLMNYIIICMAYRQHSSIKDFKQSKKLMGFILDLEGKYREKRYRDCNKSLIQSFLIFRDQTD